MALRSRSVPDPDEEQALAVLRDAVPDGVEDRVTDPVSRVGQIGSSVISDVSAADREHARHVLHHHSERSPQLRCVQKAEVELVPRIGRMAFVGQAVELRAANREKP